MKFSIRSIFVLVALAAILSATFAVVLHQIAIFEQESKRDRVACLILQYISANDDQWPPDWESLKPYYIIHPNDDYDFQQLTEELNVDFTLDKATLFEIADDPERARPVSADQTSAHRPVPLYQTTLTVCCILKSLSTTEMFQQKADNFHEEFLGGAPQWHTPWVSHVVRGIF